VKLKIDLSGDRILWIIIGVLGITVLAGILFTPPEWTPPPDPYADDPSVSIETLRGRVTEVLTEETIETEMGQQFVQQVEIEITTGSLKGQRVVTEHGGDMVASTSSLIRPGMRVIVDHTTTPAGERFYISDFIRWPALWTLVVLFVALTALIGQWTGVRSLFGTAFSVLVIARFILPRILAGQNPVLATLDAYIVENVGAETIRQMDEDVGMGVGIPQGHFAKAK
jgi:hypothetical protein